MSVEAPGTTRPGPPAAQLPDTVITPGRVNFFRVGTVFFVFLFQTGGPLSAVPMILAGGASLMAVVGNC